ncbi:hypothetical protein ENCLCP370B_24485 [Enterobacter cloacae]
MTGIVIIFMSKGSGHDHPVRVATLIRTIILMDSTQKGG